MVYIEGIKNGGKSLKIGKPFFVYDINGNDSLEYSKICKEVLKWFKRVIMVKDLYI